MTKTAPPDWLTLPMASARLGISPQTLRQWADDGRVPSFRTPGGHRRFRARDLAILAAARSPQKFAQSLRVLAHAALGRTRLALSDGRLADEAWYHNLPPAARDQQRDLGRRVVITLSQVITEEDDARLISDARELGSAYAQVNREHDIALKDALSAFLFFREAFFESLIELAETMPTLDALGLSRRMSRFVDEMLLTMVEAYDTPKKKNG